MDFKRKCILACAAFTVVVLAACGLRSLANSHADSAAKEEQKDGSAAPAEQVLDDEQQAEVGSYDAQSSELADMLAQYSWTSQSGKSVDIREGVAYVRDESGSTSSEPLLIKSAEKSSPASGATAWKAAVEVNGKSSVLEATKGAGDDASWAMSCSALAQGESFSSAVSHGDPVVDPVPETFASLIGEQDAANVQAAIKSFVSEQYPTALTATAPKTAEFDMGEGTATMYWQLDNKAKSKVKVVASFTGDGSYEISKGN